MYEWCFSCLIVSGRMNSSGTSHLLLELLGGKEKKRRVGGKKKFGNWILEMSGRDVGDIRKTFALCVRALSMPSGR